MVRVLCLTLCFAFTFMSVVAEAKVLWLDDPQKRTLFEKVLSDMKKTFVDTEKRTKRTMMHVLNIHVDKQKIHYDESKHKIYIDMFARVSKARNLPKYCKALVSKAKRTLFGTAVKEKLLALFPSVDEKDLRYFIKFRGRLDTYGIVGADGSSSPVSTAIAFDDIPSRAEPIKTTRCTNNVLSDKVIFYNN